MKRPKNMDMQKRVPPEGRASARPDPLVGVDIAEISEAVPLFGSWRNAYLTIFIVFVLEVALFYFVSRYFA